MALRRLVPVVLTSLAALALFLAPPAAAATCAFAGSTMTVTYAANDTVTLAVSGTAITMNGAACGAATTLNTNLITTAGTVTGNETLVISLTGGPFAPGLTVETTGTSEIELRADLGALNDVVVIVGTAGADSFDLGTVGINLNGDDDADLTIVTVESVVVQAGSGDDQVSALGNSGTGGPFTTPMVLQGALGTDELVAGPARTS
jgi:hypothetical protein